MYVARHGTASQVGVSSPVVLLFLIISIILCCLLKKDKIAKLMEMRMMSSMSNPSRSATNLNQPGVNISFTMSHPNGSQNGSLMYPVLDDRSSTFRDRCLTPYPTAPVPETNHKSRQDQEETASLTPSIRSTGESIGESIRSARATAASIVSSIRSSVFYKFHSSRKSSHHQGEILCKQAVQ